MNVNRGRSNNVPTENGKEDESHVCNGGVSPVGSGRVVFTEENG